MQKVMLFFINNWRFGLFR